jgi:hypothetical protein
MLRSGAPSSAPSQLSLHNDPAVSVNGVDLEHAFSEIKTNRGNLQAGGLLSSNDDHTRHSMPFSRGRPPHELQPETRAAFGGEAQSDTGIASGSAGREGTLMFAISSSRHDNFVACFSSCSAWPLLGKAGGTIMKRRLLML